MKNDYTLRIDLHTIYRVDNPHEKSFPAPQGVYRRGGLEMEVDSPPATRRATEGSGSKLQEPQKITTKAIRNPSTGCRAPDQGL